ncbi:SCO-spondin-like [Mercenaria mercenaria]|uniref:SCO-spondin-like n=1 Tax=Mercenaria mercenaria TaxID=6596 RepID=UPI00234F741E|nr:SCO-spondin-like [Mercenaria mercenaria]
MELYRQVAQISVFVSTILYASAWQCETLTCIVYPLSLKLWKNHIEVSSRSLKVKAGSSFSITCDGSCVGSRADPHLRWYGPDKHWIAYEGAANRVHVEQSFSSRFLKLHIQKANVGDQGLYVCRGWLGQKRGWDIKSIRLIVEPPSTTPVATPSEIVRTTTVRPTTVKPSEVVTSSTLFTTRTSRGTPRITTRTTRTATASATNTTEAINETTTEEPCLPPNFMCGSGECFEGSLVCDSFPDCKDFSDESNCASLTCTEDMQGCTDGYGCVQQSQVCDGIAQCRDKSDENPDVCNYLHL